MEINRSKIKKILLIQIQAIGDVVLTTPVFSVLRKNFPYAELHFLTNREVAGIIRGLPEIQQVLALPSSYWRLPFFYLKILTMHYQLVIDYQCTPGSAIITWVSQATYRIGWKMRRRQWAYNLYSTANAEQEYVSIQKCRALELLGIKELSTKLRIHFSESDQQMVQKYFDKLQISQQRLLVNITPLGKRPARQWLPEKIIRLSNCLEEKYQAVVFYNWGKGERDLVKKISADCHQPPFVLPDWPLTVFSAFLARVDLHISYDNGPKHLALAVGTPTLSLFATDAPVLWNPLNDPNHLYILADVSCRLCRLKKCPLMICMKQIEATDILRIMENIPAIQHKLKKNQT